MRQAPDRIIFRPGWPSAVCCLRSRPAKRTTPRAVASCPAGPAPDNGMFSHITPDTVALLTSVQTSALQEWAAAEPAASPMLKAVVEVAVARKLLDLASLGERDPERLRKAALSEVIFTTPVENACGNDRAGPISSRSVHPAHPE